MLRPIKDGSLGSFDDPIELMDHLDRIAIQTIHA